MYSPEINKVIVRETNREAQRCINLPETSDYIRRRWYAVTNSEMYAFIGILLECGVIRSGGRILNKLFDEHIGNPLIRATMSCE